MDGTRSLPQSYCLRGRSFENDKISYELLELSIGWVAGNRLSKEKFTQQNIFIIINLSLIV